VRLSRDSMPYNLHPSRNKRRMFYDRSSRSCGASRYQMPSCVIRAGAGERAPFLSTCCVAAGEASTPWSGRSFPAPAPGHLECSTASDLHGAVGAIKAQRQREQGSGSDDVSSRTSGRLRGRCASARAGARGHALSASRRALQRRRISSAPSHRHSCRWRRRPLRCLAASRRDAVEARPATGGAARGGGGCDGRCRTAGRSLH
jgi:hypothetical protein